VLDVGLMPMRLDRKPDCTGFPAIIRSASVLRSVPVASANSQDAVAERSVGRCASPSGPLEAADFVVARRRSYCEDRAPTLTLAIVLNATFS